MVQLVKDDDKYDKLRSKIASQIKTKRCRVVEIAFTSRPNRIKIFGESKSKIVLGPSQG